MRLSDGSLAFSQKSSRTARVSQERMLGCDLFIGEARNVCTLTGVLDRDAADIAPLIEIQNSVLIEILRFSYFGRLKLNVESVSVLKIFDVHGVNDRSKKAL
ncbi:MAG: hypothetical protein QOF62_1700 [Pyrinomonadaceae bacterium]|nr:hypothetical protein [Pyrinomonadaceae bacterium]